MRIIAGEARGRTIVTPAGRHTRPTLDRVRENLFNMLQSEIPECRVLDLFAGSGALSLEALSRGASFAVLVDSDRNANTVQKKNIEALRFSSRTRVFHSDWRKALEKLRSEKESFDLVFLDPPYAMQDLTEVFSQLIPVIHENSLVILEHEAGARINVPDRFSEIRQRAWGYCAVSFYRLSA